MSRFELVMSMSEEERIAYLLDRIDRLNHALETQRCIIEQLTSESYKKENVK